MTVEAPTKKKIKGPFHAIQRDELITLHKLKIINNSAFVYFALSLEHPPSIRGEFTINTKLFCINWGIAESSLYAAIAKLRELNLLKIRSSQLSLSWGHSQLEEVSRNLESLSDPREDSRTSEKVLSDPREDSRILEFQTSKRRRGKESRGAVDLLDLKEDQLDQREREISEKTVENSEPSEQEKVSTVVPLPPELQPVDDQFQGAANPDQNSAAAPLAKNFDWKKFDWTTYLNPGDGGSDPEFWAHTWSNVQLVHEERIAKGEPGIGDPHAFTLGCIHRHGAERYAAYLIAIGKLPSPTPSKPQRSQRGQDADPNPLQNGSGRHVDCEPYTPPTPEDLFVQRLTHLQGLHGQGELRKMQELFNALISNGERSQVDRLLVHFPDWEIRRNKVWRMANE